MTTPEITSAAQAALHEAGLLVDTVEFDGKLHRVPTRDKPHSKNGAYIGFSDAPASLWWQDWASGESGTWTAKGENKLTASEKAELSRRMEESRKAREAEQARVHKEAAKKAQAIYAAAEECTEHPYLAAKGVQAVSGLKVAADGKLIVPARNEHLEPTTLQFVDAAGGKRFLTGGKKSGSFFTVGAMPSAMAGDFDTPVLVAEGLATALSLHECLGLGVFVAFDAGNLPLVAKAARARYLNRKIIICADNDIKEDGSANVGVDAARAAAVAIDGFIAVPRHEGRKCDWNDLHQKMGAAEVSLQFQTHKKPEPVADDDKEEAETEALPSGFSLRTGGTLPGLWHTEQKEGGEPVETWIGPPLHVLGATRDENGNAWGLLLQWQDPDGRTHTWAMARSFLTGRDSSAWLGRLADEGWCGAAEAHARKLLTRYLTTYRTKHRALCVPCTGWHHNAFVLPDAVIINSAGQPHRENDLNPSSNETGLLDMLDNERIVLQIQTPHNPFRMAGTLDGWRSTIGEWSRGNTRLMLAVCASLAAPLLDLSVQESGGFNWMGQSSTGKTTALVAAGSVWGKGSSSGGYVQNWRATSNGLEGQAALHSDAALCLDEIGQAPGRTIMEASYMLANGMGKSRAYQDGSARAARSWRCMVLSTGEKGLAEKIAEEGGRVQAGQAVRLIDVPADAGAGMGIFEDLHGHESPQAFADALKLAASTDYGHAARAFISKVQQCREESTNTLYKGLEAGLSHLCPADADGQVKRVTRRFLLCALAGEMAAEWELLPWKQGQALAAVKVCFDAWLSHRGGTGAAEDTAIIEQVKLFIEQHGASRFQDIENSTATCINRVGFKSIQGTNAIYYVLPESFKEVCKGYGPDKAARVLRDAGILLPDGKRLKRWLPTLPGLGRQAGYILSFPGGENERT